MMQILASWATLIAMLILSVGSATDNPAAVSQAAPMSTSNDFGIYSVAACRDTTTVTVSGSSANATNRILASVSYLNSDGKYQVLQQVASSNFGSGSFWMPVVLDYHAHPVDADTSLQIIVQLQRSSGGGFVNLGGPVTTYVTAADRYCLNQCSVAISTSDRAPVNGVITLRSHFGSWFRPEGWTQGVMSVNAGRAVQATFADVPCNAWVRVWFYPASGADRTPRMLPSQYWPDEFGTAAAGASAPYATAFARGLPATMPLEPGDPFAPR
jgi:hypothetical protein